MNVLMTKPLNKENSQIIRVQINIEKLRNKMMVQEERFNELVKKDDKIAGNT